MGQMPSTYKTILLCLFWPYLVQQSNFSAKLWLPQLFGNAYLSILRISCIQAVLSLDHWLFLREVGFPKQIWTWCALNGWVEMAAVFHCGVVLSCFWATVSLCPSSYRIAPMHLTIWVVLFWTHVLWVGEKSLSSGLASVDQDAASHLWGAALPQPFLYLQHPAAPSNWACCWLKPLNKL